MNTSAATMQPSLQSKEQPTRRRGPGRPFPKGVSGNPSGSHQPKSKRYFELHASIVGDLGELSGLEAIAVEQIVRALIRAERAKDHALAARCSRTAQSWLRDLRERRAVQAPLPQTVEEMLNG